MCVALLGCNLSVVGSIWVVLGPSPGYLVGIKCVGHFYVVERCKIEQSQALVIDVCVAVGATCAFPVFMFIFIDPDILVPVKTEMYFHHVSTTTSST